MYAKLNNKKSLDIVDKYGYKVQQVDYRNIPLAEMYPEEDVVLIKWIGDNNKRPAPEELAEPIEYNGKKYYGNLAWGSAIKKGVTLGLTHDFPA